MTAGIFSRPLLSHPVLGATAPRHSRPQFAFVLEEVQMPPSLLHRVMHGRGLATFGARPLVPAYGLELEFAGLALKAALAHSPALARSQRHREKLVGVHAASSLPDLRLLCITSLPSFPPERLPRRAARGLGVRSPHQSGSSIPSTLLCLPLKSAGSRIFRHAAGVHRCWTASK